MIKFFCDLTNQSFAASFLDRSSPRHLLTAGSKEPVEVYLVRPTNQVRFPFMFDPDSGSGDLESPVITLYNPSGGPLTLTVPALLTPIRNGFTGIINLATAEVLSFLGNLAERSAVLSLDAVKDTLPRALFQAPIFLRPSATATTPTDSYELSGASPALAVTAAGTTDLAPIGDFIQWFQVVNVTPGGSAFTHKLTIDSARALPGAHYVLEINIPAGAHPPTIEIYDNGVTGSLLDTITGDTDNDVAYRFEAILLSDHTWIKDNTQYL